MKKLNLIYLLIFLVIPFSCKKKECDLPSCSSISSNGNKVVFTVTGNVSGGNGTQIRADSIDMSSITNHSALVTFQIVKIGKCHKVLGYGHVWSSLRATPVIGDDNFADYGTTVNFGDNATTLITDLKPNTTYWVRSWIAVEKNDCNRERKVFYNDQISTFTTL
jgi:hypothetical protein